MDSLGIVCSLLFIISVVIVGVLIYSNSKCRRIVSENSERVRALVKLNRQFAFKVLKPRYLFLYKCNSKRQLERFSHSDYLVSLINETPKYFDNLVSDVNYNIAEYGKYTLQVEGLKSTATAEQCASLRINLTKFIKIEEQVFQKLVLLSPQMELNIVCKASYTSPQGRNHYHLEKNFDFYALKKLIERAKREKENQASRKYQIGLERAKMTDSLRYDILKRDGFRCQICGSTQKDGVKLHVDHIYPVSKGGRTVPENLQTLCERCNMGKSNKT